MLQAATQHQHLRATLELFTVFLINLKVVIAIRFALILKTMLILLVQMFGLAALLAEQI